MRWGALADRVLRAADHAKYSDIWGHPVKHIAAAALADFDVKSAEWVPLSAPRVGTVVRTSRTVTSVNQQPMVIYDGTIGWVAEVDSEGDAKILFHDYAVGVWIDGDSCSWLEAAA